MSLADVWLCRRKHWPMRPTSNAAMRQPNVLWWWQNWRLLQSDIATMRWSLLQCQRRGLLPGSAITKNHHNLLRCWPSSCWLWIKVAWNALPCWWRSNVAMRQQSMLRCRRGGLLLTSIVARSWQRRWLKKCPPKTRRRLATCRTRPLPIWPRQCLS
jgi:hypothetical protein